MFNSSQVNCSKRIEEILADGEQIAKYASLMQFSMCCNWFSTLFDVDFVVVWHTNELNAKEFSFSYFIPNLNDDDYSIFDEFHTHNLL